MRKRLAQRQASSERGRAKQLEIVAKTDFGLDVLHKEKWFQVTKVTAHSPTGMHGLKLAFEDAGYPAAAPHCRLWATAIQHDCVPPLAFLQ